MARQKKAVTVILEEHEVPGVMHQYSSATSKLKVIEGRMEQQIQKVREKYEREVSELQLEQADCFDKLKAYGEHYKDSLFSKKKSADFTHGVMGFRIGTPKVTAVGITLKKAFEMVKELGLGYVRVKEELDRDKIIASRADEKAMLPLNKIGLHVVQDETFFVEPKEEELVPA